MKMTNNGEGITVSMDERGEWVGIRIKGFDGTGTPDKAFNQRVSVNVDRKNNLEIKRQHGDSGDWETIVNDRMEVKKSKIKMSIQLKKDLNLLTELVDKYGEEEDEQAWERLLEIISR